MARKIRAFDWGSTPLGPIASWPAAARIAVDMALSSRLPICLFFGQDLIAIFNDAYVPLIGGKKDSLGEPYRVTYAEVWESLGPVAMRALAGEAVFFEDYPIELDRFGRPETGYFTFSYSPLRDENGAIIGLIDSVVETTATVLARQHTERQYQHLAELFEQAPAFMTLLRGPEHRFEYANPQYRRLVGHRDIIGHTVRDALPETVPQGFVALLDTVYASGEPYTAHGARIDFLNAATGKMEETFVDFVYQPIRDGEGRITGIFVEGADVTDRIRADTALRESEQRFRDMADSVSQMIWVTRPDGVHEYRNRRWHDYTGMPYGPPVAGDWNTYLHPDDRERADERWRRSLATGDPYEIEYRLRRCDGVFRWALGRAECVRDDDGRITKWYGTCTDIQDLVDARQAAEAANLAKSEFLANMSHEIRTPMNAVIGLSGLLSKSSPLTPRQRDFIGTLQASADSLLGLINDLLDIAKIEARTVELEAVPFSLARLIDDVAGIVAAPIRKKGLNFTTDTSSIAGRQFVGDPTRVRQIITNLCSNAAKFTDQGAVHVAVSCTAGDHQGFETVCISVRDTGIGIAADKLATIFDKFVQADSSINRRYGGTGLGLAISRALAEVMGGTISVESTPGQGSTFTVQVPLRIADGLADGGDAPAAPGAEARSDDGPRILLVEDYEPNILVARTFLEQFGYQVDVATTGLEAVERTHSDRYAAIVMDVQMPGLSGLEATRMIRDRESEAGAPRLPVVGMTAHALAGDRERCLAAGMDDYIAKPFEPDDLQRRLAALVRPN